MAEAQASPRMRAAVVLAAAILLLAGLGAIDASAPDEPRYLQVAEEMRSMQHGPAGLALLHLNGEPYTQKPPLYYWLAALCGWPLGRVTELAGRLPSALSGILVVWLTLRFGVRLFGGAAGVLGGALLLTVFEFAHVGRRIQLDMLLTLLETTALVCFWWTDRALGRGRRFVALFHAAMGLAVLTKGPVGFLVPVLTVVAYLAWERRLRELAGLFPPWGLLLSVVPGLAWVAVATTLAPAGFADEALGTNVLGRFFAGTSHARPFYYYLYQFPIDFLPWTFLWPVVYWAGRHRVFASDGGGGESGRAWRFLLAWVGVSVFFFSVSAGKRGIYLLPCFPAVALLCADASIRALGGRARVPRAFSALAGALALVAAAVGAEALLAGAGSPLLLPEALVRAIRTPLLTAFGCAAIGVSASGFVAWLLVRRNRARVLWYPGVAVATALGLELGVFLLLYPALDPITSPRPIAVAAARLTAPDEPIGLLSDRAMIGGLAYYGRRRVVSLGTPESVKAFVDGGGRAIVVKRRKLGRIEAVTPVDVLASARTGRREVVVVSPRAVGGTTREGGVPP